MMVVMETTLECWINRQVGYTLERVVVISYNACITDSTPCLNTGVLMVG